MTSIKSCIHIHFIVQVIADKAMAYPLLNGGGNFDAFQLIQLILTPICTVFSFAFTVPLVLKRIVEEKQQGVKELMKMMGLPSWLHWVGWFSITTLTSLITISIMVMVIIFCNVFQRVDGMILFITLFLYGFSTMCFNFAQSTIFNNRKCNVMLKKFLLISLFSFSQLGCCNGHNGPFQHLGTFHVH